MVYFIDKGGFQEKFYFIDRGSFRKEVRAIFTRILEKKFNNFSSLL